MISREDQDLSAWKTWNSTHSEQDKTKLFNRLEPIIYGQVKRWAGPLPQQALYNKAKTLAFGALKTYDPDRGVKLSTHVTNAIQPISRIVYTHQNTVRLPENLTQKVGAYQNAVERLTLVHGRQPTTAELHSELGWPASEIDRTKNYMRKDLVESVGNLSNGFFTGEDDLEMDSIGALFFDLSPEEKRLFEYATGYNRSSKLNNTEIMKKMGLSQAQLSYKKTLLRKKIEALGV